MAVYLCCTFPVVAVAIGQRADTDADQCRAIPCQMLIEGTGKLRLHFVGGNALGVEHPVFQGNVSDFQRGKQVFIGWHMLHPFCDGVGNKIIANDILMIFLYYTGLSPKKRADFCCP